MNSLKIPQHVAIIMDGNGRWANKNGKPTIVGHKEGAMNAQKIIARAAELGISFITLYTFSSENWRRHQSWVEEFLTLLRWYLHNQMEQLHKNQVKIQVIGDRSRFPDDIQTLLSNAESQTKDHKRITVNLALSYSGRDEIVRVIKKMALDVLDTKLEIDKIDESLVEQQYLDTHGIPDPDLLIRTSGESRVSNFLLWQIAYTEFVFVDKLWPDFSVDDFNNAIAIFQKRERRYGL